MQEIKDMESVPGVGQTVSSNGAQSRQHEVIVVNLQHVTASGIMK